MPGHVRFLPNMLAGVGGVSACVFVVDASEGWKPQSEEHLRILQLLGIEHGLIALTKADLVDADLLELAGLEVAERVESTFLEAATVVAVSTVTGHGLDELRTALDELVSTAAAALDRGRPRLWVDRVFAAAGSGTVVTGTLGRRCRARRSADGRRNRAAQRCGSGRSSAPAVRSTPSAPANGSRSTSPGSTMVRSSEGTA